MSVPGVLRYLVELIATFFLTLALIGAANQDLALGALAIAAMVAVLVHRGADANPVITLAAVLARARPAQDLLPYWAGQFVGALLAAALSRWLIEAPAVDPLQDVGLVTLAVVELLFAFALCHVVLAGSQTPPFGLAAGLVVLASAAVLDPVAASAFNPAAAFGQVVSGVSEWSTIWVYLVACPIGGALAGLVTQPRRGVQPSRVLD